MIRKIHTKFEEGMVVATFLDYKNEKKFAGNARLIERMKTSDTFYEDDEILYEDPDNLQLQQSNKLPRPLSKKEKLRNRQYKRLEHLIESNDKSIRKFIEHLELLCDKSVRSMERMDAYIDRIRSETTSPGLLKTLLNEFDNLYLIRFIQQTTIKNFTPTLYNAEFWLVEYEGPQETPDGRVLFFKGQTFRTNRWIRKLVAIGLSDAPLSNHLSQKTTYNGRSSTKHIEHVDDKSTSLDDEL
jgi:hypothetical protein